MRTTYSSVAKWWHLLLTLGGFERGLRHFVHRLPLLSPKIESPKILEIGCGSAAMSFAILERYPTAEVLATDADEIMLRQVGKLREKRGIKKEQLGLACSDANYPHSVQYGCTGSWEELPKETFDLVVAGAVLEHVELERAVRNVYELLRPGGVFLILAMRDDSFLTHVYEWIYNCVPRTIAVHRASLQEVGFESILVEKGRMADFSAQLTRVAIIARKAASRADSEDAVYTVPVTKSN